MKYSGASWNFRRGTVGIKAIGCSSSSVMTVMVDMPGEGTGSPWAVAQISRLLDRTVLSTDAVLTVDEVSANMASIVGYV